MAKKSYYITTTIPYVNAKPHVGFALEIVQADALARYHKLLGEDVVFSTGTDEHGVKIYRKAIEEGKDPQKFVDEFAEKFGDLKKSLNLDYTNFIRTTDPAHIAAAQEFWKLCDDAHDIYKKNYKIKYCSGCELEKTDSELVDGRCPLHPKLEIDVIEEENYFFKLSKYQDKILKYLSEKSSIIPEPRRAEAIKFVESGLQDFSISRLKEKMPWGVPVPDDNEQVMYVWFDALVNYISTLGWPKKDSDFEKFWDKGFNVQVAGKDQIRMQSIMWQGMLMSAGLPLTKQVFYHGFITSGGQKMSKSLGNVIDPFEIVDKYGTDPLRYFLLAKLHSWQDSDFTVEKFEEAFQADLANGLGNLVSRVAKLAELQEIQVPKTSDKISYELDELDQYRFDRILEDIWDRIRLADVLISDKKLWENTNEKLETLESVILNIRAIACDLQPFLPETSKKIEDQFKGPKIKSGKPLFPRLDR